MSKKRIIGVYILLVLIAPFFVGCKKAPKDNYEDTYLDGSVTYYDLSNDQISILSSGYDLRFVFVTSQNLQRRLHPRPISIQPKFDALF